MTTNEAEQVAREMAEICLRMIFPHNAAGTPMAANYLKDKLMAEWRKQHGKMWEAEKVTT